MNPNLNLNVVMLMGRLTRDPILRHTDGGVAVTEVSLAINRMFTTSSGERRKESCYVDIVFWKARAEAVCERLKQGHTIFIRGRLELDQWQGPDGNKRSRLRVVANEFQQMDIPKEAIDE